MDEPEEMIQPPTTASSSGGGVGNGLGTGGGGLPFFNLPLGMGNSVQMGGEGWVGANGNSSGVMPQLRKRFRLLVDGILKGTNYRGTLPSEGLCWKAQ